jgi:hypothetical protein
VGFVAEKVALGQFFIESSVFTGQYNFTCALYLIMHHQGDA